MWTRLLAEQSEVAKRMSANSRWNEWQGDFRFDAQFCKTANLQAGDPIFLALVQGTLQAVSARLLVREGEKLFRVKHGQEPCSESGMRNNGADRWFEISWTTILHVTSLLGAQTPSDWGC
jgi:hypothetical protein